MRSKVRRLRTIPVMILVAALGAGCGSAGEVGGADTGGEPSVTAAPQPLPGTVSLDVSGVTDARGLVMLAVIGNGVPNQAFAAACAIVDAEPFSFSGVYLPITGDDPCSLGTEPVEFAPGAYEVTVAVLPGGARTPEQCTQASVVVDGDVTVEVTGLGPPTDCQF